MKRQVEFLDVDNWNRTQTFRFYKDFDQPCFNLCANVDVTGIKKESQEKGSSFFLLSLFYATRAANDVEHFRYRFKDNKVAVYSSIYPGCTILYDDESFGFAYFDFNEDKDQFLDNGRKVVNLFKKGNQPLVPVAPDNGLLHFSVIPWLSFTSFKHASQSQADQSIPKIVFGKVTKLGEKYSMPVSVEVHHALMDGLHVARYFEAFESYCR
jgi:chloramphenicol O-acetyltransferase type A